MAIHYEYSVEVNSSPEQAFAVIDDLARTPEWLCVCVSLEKLIPGPNKVGDKLKYTFKQGKRIGVMDGEITARIPVEKLTYQFDDKMFQVVIDFNISPTSVGAKMTHLITITTKTFAAKLMAPLIRLGVPKQTKDAMHALKAILDSGAR
ncbi:MAG: SRPBCC family protein [Planctomycetaceae bacterium]